MKKIIKAAIANESEMLDLLDEAVKAIKAECDRRNEDEYPDDLKWGADRFEVPVFKYLGEGKTEKVAVFRFIYDKEDEDDLPIEEQMRTQLDEFLEELNY